MPGYGVVGATNFGQKKASRKRPRILDKHGIDALIPIGGDGTFRGATNLLRHWNGQIVGCPGTIDNDLIGTDFTIGFSTAVQTAVEAVDKIRDTAESHERMFLVEVMGRHSGYIALYTALACGAEDVCIPETDTDVTAIADQLRVLEQRGKTSVMIIVAEGDERGGAEVLQQSLVESGCPATMRVVVLGHLQRGGCPSAEDRILASRLGEFAVTALGDGATGVMAGVINGKNSLTRFEETFTQHKTLPAELLDLLGTLAM